jgi:UDP-N-acetylmuramyl pentapeptide phosphotransferase/UDP-N-acetylglucosamine-1-phosphate transferase
LRALLTILLAFAASALLTFLFVRWAQQRRIVAFETHRSMHKGAVPVGGGLPLIVSALGTFALLWPVSELPLMVLAALVALALVSWRDDVAALPAGVRLAVHALAAATAIAALPADALVFQGALPWALDRAIALLALVWLINLTNFMDGIDGIAGAEVAAVTFGYAVVALAMGAVTVLSGLALAVTGAALGFLVWNWAPARIFMGDVGSVPLGFLSGVLMLDLAARGALAAALVLPLYFVADATITLLRRIAAGERPWEAHRSHFYQRAAAVRGHAAVSGRVAVCNAALIILAVLSLSAPWVASALAVLAVGSLIGWMQRAAHSERA